MKSTAGAAARQTSIRWAADRHSDTGRAITGANQRRVHEHRQWVLGLARGRDVLCEAREMPRHEDPSAGRRPRIPGPRAGTLRAGREPRASQFERERLGLLGQVSVNSPGTAESKARFASALRSRASGIMPISFSTCTIEHRVRLAVDGLHVLHQRRKGARIGVTIGGRERRKHLETAAARSTVRGKRRWSFFTHAGA